MAEIGWDGTFQKDDACIFIIISQFYVTLKHNIKNPPDLGQFTYCSNLQRVEMHWKYTDSEPHRNTASIALQFYWSLNALL